MPEAMQALISFPESGYLSVFSISMGLEICGNHFLCGLLCGVDCFCLSLWGLSVCVNKGQSLILPNHKRQMNMYFSGLPVYISPPSDAIVLFAKQAGL